MFHFDTRSRLSFTQLLENLKYIASNIVIAKIGGVQIIDLAKHNESVGSAINQRHRKGRPNKLTLSG